MAVVTEPFRPSAATLALDFQYHDALLDQRAYHWWLDATIAWFLIVFCGGMTTGIWLGVATSDPDGVNYGPGVGGIILGSLLLGLGGTVLGAAICTGYWHRDDDGDGYTSPGRYVTRLRYRLDESRQRDADEFMQGT